MTGRAAPVRWQDRLLDRSNLRVGVAGTVLLGLLLFLTVYPLVMLLYGSFRSAPPGLPARSASLALSPPTAIR